MTKRQRVILADDHTLLLEAFKALLEPEYDVIATVSDGRALLDAAQELKPDIVILDIAMPILNGMDAGAQLNQTLPKTKLVFLTMSQDPALAAKALQVGASGYVLKSSAASELLTALAEVQQGRTYVTPLITQGLVETLTQKTAQTISEAQLTPRQREVLQLLAEGRTMKQAGRVLDVAPRTIAFHKYRIMEAFGLKTNADLVQLALKQGLISMESEQ